jgi:phosphatidylethanolamine-binding protein (PEBP) family uncharacterized protein
MERSLHIRSNSFSDGETIPGEFAFAVIDADHRVAPGRTKNLQLAWDDVPEGTKSFVVEWHDPEIGPCRTKSAGACREGKKLSADKA